MRKKFVDVERIIASKNEKLLKRLPRFIISYLKRILHQEEINQIIHENRDLHNEAFCNEIVERFKLKLHSDGADNIPKDGGAIFVVNHPLGGMDAMALVSEFTRYRKDIRFIVNDILLTLENLKGLFVGVNKHGSNVKDSMKDVDRLFASDHAIFVFPAGLVSRKIGDDVIDLDWKKAFVTQAVKYNKSVIPVYLEGELSPFFYRLSKIRQWFRIKLNLEMLFLVNELFKQKNKTIRITFGKAIPATNFDKSKTHRQWASWVKGEVYKLKTIDD
ncbi:MAG: putative hemolysin [Bacteroidia bacterium]|jgi:putative hemolysin